jgi:hypothetical protein
MGCNASDPSEARSRPAALAGFGVHSLLLVRITATNLAAVWLPMAAKTSG